MEKYLEILVYILGFLFIAVASGQISRLFLKWKLPLITGLILMGIIAGPYVLKLIPVEAPRKLHFITEISLAFIAFVAGSELYLKEIRSRFRSIAWNTFGQLVITFILGSTAVYLLADMIPFMKEMTIKSKLAVSILAGTIFVARSPSSAIAVINELRAKGPFTKTAIGVTVVIDVLVIILFAICFSLSAPLIQGDDFKFITLIILVIELAISFGMGYLIGKVLPMILRLQLRRNIKIGIVLITGYLVYLFSHFARSISLEYFGHEIYLEPLLICIIASFIITNFSFQRAEFQKILQDVAAPVYVVFFTLTGVAVSLDVLLEVWGIALILFGVRLFSLIISSFIGGYLASDPWKYNKVGWMSYVTQAGVGLGLVIQIASEYPTWGLEFEAIIISVIVLNQVVGPPLFKLAINYLGEAHSRADAQPFDGIHDAVIFGLENQSTSLAQQLQNHGWQVKLATIQEDFDKSEMKDIQVIKINEISKESMIALGCDHAECIIGMLSDEENFNLCEIAYEKFGTKDIVVRLHNRFNFDRFHQLGCLIVEPDTAIVSLMDHLVRSPVATSLLLGMDKSQDTIDIEITNPDLHNVQLRDLRLPSEVLILSVKRDNNNIISHGYTTLRLGDIVTVVGSVESLEKTELQFSGG